MHTDCLKRGLFSDFNEERPGQLVTLNTGVSPRRWIHCANRDLSELLTRNLGGHEGWLKDMTLLENIILTTPHSKEIKCWDKELF